MKLIKTDRRLIFDWPYDRNCRNWPILTKHFRRILKRAGLPTTRQDMFHSLRRSTASYLRAAGGNAQWQLGHSSEAVTERYLDPRITHSARQIGLLPRPTVTPNKLRIVG